VKASSSWDTGDSSGNFFYQLVRAEPRAGGLVPVRPWPAQRTRAYQTDRDIQRGVLVGFSYKQVSFTTYVFNPDESKPTLVLAVGVTF